MPRKRYWKKARKRLARKVVTGEFSQSDARFNFSSRGRQCIANCLIALIKHANTRATLWRSNDLDEILVEGDKLYRGVQDFLGYIDNYLMVTELPSTYELNDVLHEIKYQSPLTGAVGSSEAPSEHMVGIMSLADALAETFSSSVCALFTLNSNTLGIIKDESTYFVFDPHSRNRDGMVCYNGTSITLEFGCLDDVHCHLQILHRNISPSEDFACQFEMVAVEITQVVARNDTDVVQEVKSTQHEMLFSRLNYATRFDICKKLGLKIELLIDENPINERLNEPAKVVSVKADGNCFFNALSHELSGTEHNNAQLRQAIAQNIEENPCVFSNILRDEYAEDGVENYIKQSKMFDDGTWATEVEIFSACDLLALDIYTYFENTWLKYSRALLNRNYVTHSRGSIYLNNKGGNHYEIVTDVKSWQNGDDEGDPAMVTQHEVTRNTEWYEVGHTEKQTTSSMSEADMRYELCEEYRENVKKSSRRRYKTDQNYNKKSNLRSSAKYKYNASHREALKTRSVKKYETDVQHREKVIASNIQKYHLDDKYRKQVKTRSAEQKPCGFVNARNIWICHTCSSKLKSGKVPVKAWDNNMLVEEVPPELARLNSIERHLISLHIPFMKISQLPKTRQYGIHGPVICVPSNVQKTVTVLPRVRVDDQMLTIKLKRKLSYKGYYDYQVADKGNLRDAIMWLKENNDFYTDVTFNEIWNPDINLREEEEDEELLEAPSEDVIISDATLDICLQPVDIAQEVLDQISEYVLCIAPAEGNRPISILMDDKNEAKAFPTLFPSGRGTFGAFRDEQITLSRYINCRLMSADDRFSKNVDYIFFSQYRSELNQILSNISIALRKGTDSSIRKMTIKDITDGKYIRSLLTSDEAYKFLRPVRGTPAFWQAAQKDLLAMVRQLGLPTWFCSFSSAEMRWPEVFDCLLRQRGDKRLSSEIDWLEKCQILRENCVMTARLFQNRFQSFLRNIILSSCKPLGEVVDYFFRVEFQQRGSPHIHCLLWVKDSPKYGVNSNAEVEAYIDRHVTCQIPQEHEDKELFDIVNSVQQHSKSHTKSCRKKGTVCRYGFPRPPSSRTFIAQCDQGIAADDSAIAKAKDILKKIMSHIFNENWQCAEDANLAKLLEELNITQDGIEMSCRMITKKVSVILQRECSSIWTNPYNPTLLRAWNANLDVQFVTDAYACVVYILSYISKGEREMSFLMEGCVNECLNQGHHSARDVMKKIGMLYLRNREVSAQESAFRACNMPLKGCSRNVVFLPTGGDSVKISLPLSVLKNKLKASGGELNPSDMWMTSMIEKYRARPRQQEIDEICYGEFFSRYRVLSQTQAKGNKKALKLEKGLGHVQKRETTQPAIVRYPRFRKEKNSEKYYRSILELFFPHRTDEDLKPLSYKNYTEFYKFGKCSVHGRSMNVKELVTENMRKFENIREELSEAGNMLADEQLSQDEWADLITELQQRTRDEGRDSNVIHTVEDEQECDDIPDLHQTTSEITFVKNVFISKEEALPILRSLNEMQTEVFYAIRQWCVKKANGKNPDPFHLFISGGAGTGKSHLVKAIYYETSKVLANRAEDISQIRVLLTASTGVAAYNIKATTIHSTFSIPVQATIPYRPLAEEKINTLKCRYENLELLIIDEISMVDYKLLSYIHGRLRQIKSASDEFPFGKVSIIAVGDFYQLPPVKASPLFKPNSLGDLWNGYFKLVELNEIMRQKGGKKFAEMLNRIRTKKKGEIMNACDISMLSQRETGETKSDIIHIYPTNAQVNEFNLKRLLSLDKEIVEIAADVLTPTSENRSSSCRTYIPMGQLQKTLKFSVEARAMLLRNIDATDGLVNGVIGTIVSIHRAEGTIEVDVIHVRFDDHRVGAALRMRSKCRYEDGVPITKVEDSFSGRGSYKQFPLKLSWGCTIHKMQGVTVDAALVDFKKAFRAGQISECYDKNDDFFRQFKTKKQGGVGFLLRSELKVRVMDIEVLNLEFLCLLLVEKDTVLQCVKDFVKRTCKSGYGLSHNGRFQ
ncbi:uncharacterized protein LOC144421969 [Styela clava]